MREIKAISTFAGCGGSSTGYKAAGVTMKAMVEWDDHAVKCYGLNHTGTRIFHGDIAKVSGAALMEAAGVEVGELDILDGSPPCQGFSTAGRRIFDDPRNALFREQLRLIDEIQPRTVVIENVAGMIKGKMRPVAAEIVRELKARGYEVAAGLMEAQYFGVAQLRPRVFFIGSKVGAPSLPRAISRPVPAMVGLRGVAPDEILIPTAGHAKFLSHHLEPYERGVDCYRRLGKPGGSFSVSMLDPDKPARTIIKTARGCNVVYHWTRRHLAISEALALTGFPPGYQLPGSFGERWARVGNSVAPPMSREIARQVLIPLLARV